MLKKFKIMRNHPIPCPPLSAAGSFMGQKIPSLIVLVSLVGKKMLNC